MNSDLATPVSTLFHVSVLTNIGIIGQTISSCVLGIEELVVSTV